MKNISFKYLVFALVLSTGILACNDYEDENFDFSSPLPQYVELSSGEVEGVAGGEVEVAVRLRVALQTKVTVNYDISGDLSESGTIEIDAGAVSGTKMISLPDTPDTGSATLSITNVDNELSIGRGAASDGLSDIEMDISWAP